ncbi:MAG: hypothetical protein ACLFWL_01705 [Candidatus Brocadiia bacterium]
MTLSTKSKNRSKSLAVIPAPIAMFLVGLLTFLPPARGEPEGIKTPPPPKLTFANKTFSLNWQGDQLIANPLPAATNVVLETRKVNPKNNFWDYEFSRASLKDPNAAFDKRKRQVTRQYGWGEVRVRYKRKGNVLRMRLLAENRSEHPVANFRFELFHLRLPAAADKLKDGDVRNTHDRPTAIGVKTKIGQIFASYESFAPPVRFGFAKPKKGTENVYPLVVTGGVRAVARGELVMPPKGLPRIPPGETLELEFALRFAGNKERRHWVLRDFYKEYQKFQSPMLEWPDRGAVGACYILGEWGKKAPQFGIEGTNPRRLWSPILDTVDVLSPHGKAFLRRAFIRTAHRTVDALKKMNAQGMILWNLEGGFHSTGFVGAPRMLPILTPELDHAMDDYFRIIRQAGFRTGATIRHPQPRWSGNKWVQGVGNANPKSDPVKDNYHKLIPEHTPWWAVYPIAQRLSEEIAYAKKRWGCTIFYYDTSIVLRFYGENGGKRNSDVPCGHIYRKIREDHPDVLIIPEFYRRRGTHIAHLGHIAPYGQTGYGRVRPKWKKDYVRDIIPGYFGFNYVHDAGGDPWRARRDRIHEVVWGEVLGVDGWSFHGKQRAVAEYYRHAGAKQRRVTSLARRFGLVDGKREMLPMFSITRNARRIRAANIVKNPPASSQLRVFVAPSKDRRQAILLLAWYGWPLAPDTELHPSLAGLKLKGEHFRVWDLETGQLLNSRESVHVPAAPVTSLRALLVRSTDTPPPAPWPKGVSLGVSFDKGLAPDVGGGVLSENGEADRVKGSRRKAIEINPQGAHARYGVVPSWFSGTLEFDLQVKKTAAVPLPVAQLRHHMNTTLELVSLNNRPALRLRTYERNTHVDHWKSTELSPIPEEGPKLRETSASFPDDRGWHHVVLCWEMGQYRLFVDGKRVALLSAPAVVRWRDGSILQPGLILGPTNKAKIDAGAAIDSVFLYDWAFRDSDAQGRIETGQFAPVPKPETQQPSVWLWGKKPKKATRAAVNYRRSLQGRRAQKVNIRLFEKTDKGLRKLSSGDTMAYRGTALIRIEYEPETTIKHSAPVEKDESPLAGIDDVMQEAKQAETKYVLKVRAKAPGNNPPPRDITFKFGVEKKSVRNW